MQKWGKKGESSSELKNENEYSDWKSITKKNRCFNSQLGNLIFFIVPVGLKQHNL